MWNRNQRLSATGMSRKSSGTSHPSSVVNSRGPSLKRLMPDKMRASERARNFRTRSIRNSQTREGVVTTHFLISHEQREHELYQDEQFGEEVYESPLLGKGFTVFGGGGGNRELAHTIKNI